MVGKVEGYAGGDVLAKLGSFALTGEIEQFGYEVESFGGELGDISWWR